MLTRPDQNIGNCQTLQYFVQACVSLRADYTLKILVSMFKVTETRLLKCRAKNHKLKKKQKKNVFVQANGKSRMLSL